MTSLLEPGTSFLNCKNLHLFLTEYHDKFSKMVVTPCHGVYLGLA